MWVFLTQRWHNVKFDIFLTSDHRYQSLYTFSSFGNRIVDFNFAFGGTETKKTFVVVSVYHYKDYPTLMPSEKSLEMWKGSIVFKVFYQPWTSVWSNVLKRSGTSQQIVQTGWKLIGTVEAQQFWRWREVWMLSPVHLTRAGQFIRQLALRLIACAYSNGMTRTKQMTQKHTCRHTEAWKQGKQTPTKSHFVLQPRGAHQW